MSGLILLQSIPDKPPETRACLCHSTHLSLIRHGGNLSPSRRRELKLSRLCVGSGTGRPSGCLGGLLARRPPSDLALPTPLGPLFLGLPQSSLPAGPLQFPLLLSLLQQCFRSTAGQRFCSLLLVRQLFCLHPLSLSLSQLPSTETPRLCLRKPFQGCLIP